MSKKPESEGGKIHVAAFVHIQFPEDIASSVAIFNEQVEKQDKKEGIKSRHVEVLVEARGQVREFTVDELLKLLGFDVISPIQKA